MAELKVSVEFNQYSCGQSTEIRSVLEMVSGAAERPRAPFELCFVLDTSGSMAGAKLTNLKEAVIAALDLLIEGDLIHVVTYSDTPTALLVSKTVSDRLPITDAINGMVATGGTNISAALQFGAQLISQNRRDPLNPPRMFLYTDGQPTHGLCSNEALSSMLSDLREEQGILTSVFGIGTDVNGELLEIMADSGGGLYNFLTTRRIVELTKKAMQGLASVIGTRGVIRVELASPGVTVTLPTITAENRVADTPHGGFEVPVGDVRHSNLHNVAMAMRVPANLANVGDLTLASATLQYTPVENPLVRATHSVNIVARFADGPIDPDREATPAVTIAFGLVTMAASTAEAEALLTDGQREEAIRRIEAAVAELERCEPLDEMGFVTTSLRRARRTLDRMRSDFTVTGAMRAAMELQQQRVDMDRMSAGRFEASENGAYTPPMRGSPTRRPSMGSDPGVDWVPRYDNTSDPGEWELEHQRPPTSHDLDSDGDTVMTPTTPPLRLSTSPSTPPPYTPGPIQLPQQLLDAFAADENLPPDAPRSVPAEFLCPITKQLMTDPVSTDDGHTYNRASIEAWFATGQHTSPMTNLRLDDLRLRPNLNLRAQMQNWGSRGNAGGSPGASDSARKSSLGRRLSKNEDGRCVVC